MCSWWWLVGVRKEGVAVGDKHSMGKDIKEGVAQVEERPPVLQQTKPNQTKTKNRLTPITLIFWRPRSEGLQFEASPRANSL